MKANGSNRRKKVFCRIEMGRGRRLAKEYGDGWRLERKFLPICIPFESHGLSTLSDNKRTLTRVGLRTHCWSVWKSTITCSWQAIYLRRVRISALKGMVHFLKVSCYLSERGQR